MTRKNIPISLVRKNFLIKFQRLDSFSIRKNNLPKKFQMKYYAESARE